MSESPESRSYEGPSKRTDRPGQEPAPESDRPAPWWGKLILAAFPFVLLLLFMLLDTILDG